MTSKNVVVGVNASFDSIATVLLLKLQNFNISAIHILFNIDEKHNTLSQKDTYCLKQGNQKVLEDIFSELGIPLYFVDQKENFEETIGETSMLANFMKEFHAPCVLCHKIKIVSLYEKMIKLNAQFIATGHYAKLRKAGQEGLVSLYEVSDQDLDQHKLLAAVDQTILDKLLLPLSDLTREKVVSIVKEHLPNHHHLLSKGGNRKFCSVLKDQSTMVKKIMPSTLSKKSRLFLRDNKTFLNESYDNSEFEFGKTFKMGSDRRGKEQLLTVTGYNYSYQTIYVSEQPLKGVNYFFVQIVEFFGKPNLFEPMNAMISINDDKTHIPAIINFKALNYAIIFLVSGTYDYVPSKSILYIHEETRQGNRLCFYAKIFSQDFIEGVNPMKLAKLDGDYPF